MFTILTQAIVGKRLPNANISVPSQYQCSISKNIYREYYSNYNPSYVSETDFLCIVKDNIGYCRFNDIGNCTNARHRK